MDDLKKLRGDPELLRRDWPEDRPVEPDVSWPERVDRRMMELPQPWRTLYCFVWLCGAAVFGLIVFFGFLFVLALMSPL